MVLFGVVFSVAFWILLWIFIWTISYVLLKRGIGYLKKFQFFSLYFLLMSIFIVAVFYDLIFPIFDNFTLLPFVILVIVITLNFLIYKFAHNYLKKPKKLIKENPDELFLNLDYRFLVTKFFEILFQQTMVVLLILFISQVTRNIYDVMIIFAVLFSLVHLPLFKITNPREKLFDTFFTLSAFISAIIFPYLILNVNYGFVYSYIIHYTYYTLSALFFWVRKSIPKN